MITLDLTQGGIGKQICATSLVKWTAEKTKEKVIVVSYYPEIFEYNPNVYRNLSPMQPYLFEDYLKGTDIRKGDPYILMEYYRDTDKMHINKLFPKAYGFNEYNESPEMEIYLTENERKDVETFIKADTRPVITIQTSGGVAQGTQSNKGVNNPPMRDMPTEVGQKIVNYLSSKGYRVAHVRQQNEPGLQNTITFNVRFRQFIALSEQSKGHIGIDSSMLHAAAVWKKPQIIFWSQTFPENLGYTYPGAINVFKKISGHPASFSLPDQAGTLMNRDLEAEKEAWNYTDDELSKLLTDFLK